MKTAEKSIGKQFTIFHLEVIDIEEKKYGENHDSLRHKGICFYFNYH